MLPPGVSMGVPPCLQYPALGWCRKEHHSLAPQCRECPALGWPLMRPRLQEKQRQLLALHCAAARQGPGQCWQRLCLQATGLAALEPLHRCKATPWNRQDITPQLFTATGG